MNVLIVDDEKLARDELNYLVQKDQQVAAVFEAESVEEAMICMMEHAIDVLFLDIHLTDESGFDLAKKIIKLDRPPYLIFSTAYDEYAIDAFAVNAGDYILKPFEEERVLRALGKATAAFRKQSEEVRGTEVEATPERFALPVGDRMVVIHPEKIEYILIEGRELTIVTEERSFIVPGPLSKLESKLPPALLFKTHRNYLVNLAKIQEIQPWFNNTLQLTLQSGEKVPVSRSYLKDFKEKMLID